MAYLPKHKQKINIKPAGSTLYDSKNREIKGDFTQDYRGNYYKGIGITPKSEALTLVEPEIDLEMRQNGTTFVTSIVPPTEKDYLAGYYTRYFIKDTVLGKVIETDRDSYQRELDNKKLYRKYLKIEWWIKGNPDDIVLKGFKFPGLGSKNQIIIDQADTILKGIKDQLLKDPKEFVKM